MEINKTEEIRRSLRDIHNRILREENMDPVNVGSPEAVRREVEKRGGAITPVADAGAEYTPE